MTEEPGKAAFITVARLAKVQGRVGEIAAELHTDFPERFEQRRTLYAWNAGSDRRRELRLEEYWPHKGGMVFKFEGVDSIEEAEKLLGSEIQIPATERAELDEGAFYVSDLLGCLVVEVGSVAGGAEHNIGTVVDVNFGAGTAPLLIVKGEALMAGTRQEATLRPQPSDGREFMIPFVESFTKKLDLKAKRIEMQLPEDMLELDAPLSAGKKDRQRPPVKDNAKR
jgi:16S rRNA processing protein RimM